MVLTEKRSWNIPNIGKNVPDTMCDLGDFPTEKVQRTLQARKGQLLSRCLISERINVPDMAMSILILYMCLLDF